MNEYSKAGVTLESGYESVERIKKHINRTKRPGMMGGIGSFGGMFDFASLGYKDPILVAGTDGVGTKLVIAQMMQKATTIGIDVVAMCVNDLLAQGASPLFFLDYIAVGKMNPKEIEDIVAGVADGCVMANAALIGGETAEMPGMYPVGEYDIAGFSVGVVERAKLLEGKDVKKGDVLVGIHSSGLHSNGYSLVRKVVLADNHKDLNEYIPQFGKTLGEELLTPTKIYIRPVHKVLESVNVHAIANITGGGFIENIPRMMPEGLGTEIIEEKLPKMPVFTYLEKLGNIPHHELYNVWNMGIGMVMVLDEKDADKAIEILKANGENASVIGSVIDQEGVVIK